MNRDEQGISAGGAGGGATGAATDDPKGPGAAGQAEAGATGGQGGAVPETAPRISPDEVDVLVARWTGGQQPGKQRVRILDTLRGFSVVSMVLFHAMYNLVFIFGMQARWFQGMPGYLWQQSICWVFLLVSGASQHFGLRPYRRALVVLGCALAVTLVTWLILPQQRILFGILHCIGLCMVFTALLKPVLAKVPPTLGFYVFFILFLLLKGLPNGYIGLGDVPIFYLPRALYTTPFLFPLGLPGPRFASSDYFPLLPWFLLYLAGWFFWDMAGDFAKSSTQKSGPLAWVGRHSLEIYMLHQPVLYGAMWLLQKVGVLAF